MGHRHHVPCLHLVTVYPPRTCAGMTPAEPLAVLLDATTAAAPDADIATDAWRAMRPGRGPRALEQQWWAGYYRCTRQYWSSATGGSLVLMALGVAGLVKEPPDRYAVHTVHVRSVL